MEKKPILSLRNVGAYYWRRGSYLRQSRHWALRDVSFDVYHGESLGIVGRNGAGKSTLLQLLAGIIKPDRGQIITQGASAALLSLQIGFVPYLTGRENAILSGLLLGMHRSEVKQKMAAIVAFAELGEFLDDPIRSYSTGMKARLGFSVAFQLDPDILLIDEVLGVGDAEFRRKSTEKMKDKIRSEKTIVIVSHNPNTIRDLCDRAVWIDDGITRDAGDPIAVIQRYNDAAISHHKS